MSFPSVAEAGLLTASLGISLALPGVSNARGWAALAGFALGAVLFTGINGFFPALPELGSQGSLLNPCYSSPPCLFLGFSLCICFLHPLLSAEDATGTERREGGTAQWQGENFSCCSLVPVLHGLLQT